MNDTDEAFRMSLARLHLEELSSLVGQRHTLLRTPDLSWRTPEPLELRIEAHLDALGTCLPDALTLTQQFLESPYWDDTVAGTLALLHLRGPDALEGIVERQSLSAASTTSPFVEGLRLFGRLPEGAMVGFVGHSSPAVRGLAAALLRSESEAEPLLTLLDDPEDFVRDMAARGLVRLAIGLVRLAIPASQGALAGALDRMERREQERTGPGEGLSGAVVELACLGMGSPRARARLGLAVKEGRAAPWQYAAYGLAATRDEAHTLARAIRDHGRRPGSLMGLAYAGEPSAVPWLLAELASGPEPGEVAAALAVLLGTRFLEPQSEPEDEDDDAGVEGDRSMPMALLLPGVIWPAAVWQPLRRVSQDERLWHGWWLEHERTLSTLPRIRGGLELSAESLAELLLDPTGALEHRYWWTLELAMLSQGDCVLDASARVREQCFELESFLTRRGRVGR